MVGLVVLCLYLSRLSQYLYLKISGMNDPAQKDMWTRRYRRVKAPEPSETQIHIAVVEHCRRLIKPDVLFFHCPNGEHRNKRTAAKLKAMGVLPGVADLIFIRAAPWSFDCTPDILFLELKRKGQKQSDNQLAFEPRAKACGAQYRVADSVDAAIDILEHGRWVRQRSKVA